MKLKLFVANELYKKEYLAHYISGEFGVYVVIDIEPHEKFFSFEQEDRCSIYELPIFKSFDWDLNPITDGRGRLAIMSYFRSANEEERELFILGTSIPVS